MPLLMVSTSEETKAAEILIISEKNISTPPPTPHPTPLSESLPLYHKCALSLSPPTLAPSLSLQIFKSRCFFVSLFSSVQPPLALQGTQLLKRAAGLLLREV